MKQLLNPRSIAIIGASRDPSKIGNGIVANLKHFKGKVYPVNPNAKSILGFKCYNSVLKIPGKIDLGVVVVE